MNRGVYLLVCDLSKKYGFDCDDALTYVGVNKSAVDVVEKVSDKAAGRAEEKVKEKKKGSPRKKKIPMPWLGRVNEENCKALVFNHGLCTQCESAGVDNRGTFVGF